MTDMLPVVAGSVPVTREAARDALALLRLSLVDLDDQRQEMEAAGDYESLILGLVALKRFQHDLAILTRAIEQSAISTMPEKRVSIDSADVVAEVHRSATKTVWEPEELLARVLREAIDPEHTGELPPLGELLGRVERAIGETAGLTPSHGWRVTGLKKLGIIANDYRTQQQGDLRLSLITGDDT